MEEILNEVLETIKWIPLRERNTKTYLQYLNKAIFDAKLALEIEVENNK